MKNLSFKTKCNIEFKASTYDFGNWEGYMRIGRKPYNPDSDPELIEDFCSDGEICKSCLECKLDKVLKEEDRHLCRKGDINKRLDVVETYCVADLIEHPYPKKCPVTGFPFDRLAYDRDSEKIIPLYKNNKDKLQTLMWLKLCFDELRYMFKVVETIDEDNCMEYETGSYIYRDTKKSIVADLKDITEFLDVSEDKSIMIYKKAKYLLEMFSNLEFSEDDKHRKEEDDDREDVSN